MLLDFSMRIDLVYTGNCLVKSIGKRRGARRGERVAAEDRHLQRLCEMLTVDGV